MRRVSLLPLLALLLAGCAIPEPLPPPEASPLATAMPLPTLPADTPSPTGLTLYEPWGPDGLRPEYPLTGEAEGSCFVGALRSSRPDAWRCGTTPAGSGLSILFDPCLENPYDPQSPLACMDASGRVTLLSLTEPLPRAFANLPESETLPLAITLDGGDVCDLVTGATITVAIDGEQQRVNYFCQSGGVLIGRPDESDAIWTIHYSADPRGEGEIRTVGIAQAVAFRGGTANVGWSSGSDNAGPLQAVASEVRPGLTRLTFVFGPGGLPDYEIGYVREPVVDETGQAVHLDGDFQLRVRFLFPTTDAPTYAGPRRASIASDANVHEAVLAVDGGGSQTWYIGLGLVAGFQARRDADGGRLTLDIYDPEPTLALRPVLFVGREGDAVLALADALIAAGYLDARPAGGRYSEEVRQAVVAFEAANGLVPDGVVGPDTWATLERPLPPPRLGQSARQMRAGKLAHPAAQDNGVVTPAGNIEVYVRGGPGLDYPPVGSLLPGQTAAVVGQQTGSGPETSWWQIAEPAGWVRADVVNVSGAANTAPPAEPPPAPAAGGNRPGSRPSHSADGAPILYFTFDDGPMAGSSEVIAALMAENGGRGTFFNIGRQVNWTPALVASVATGHSVQNHTYNHTSLDTVTRADFFSEVEQTQRAILQATGVLPTCLRPPYGATDATTYQMAGELGLDVSLWTVDTQDWMRPGVDAIVNHILGNASPGAIILMHDGGGDRAQTIEALRVVLPQLRARGYVFEALCG